MLKRHDEYREVLQRFLDVVKNDKGNRAIVVTGDVLHSKTELTPECVQLARWFFASSGKICPTFVICGAHDINLSNKARLDSLTPLLSDIDGVHYFCVGGNYQYDNILFSATTIRDKQIVRPPTVSDDLTKVCMMYSSALEPDFGSEFDIVMLGGSHKGGMISPHIGYCSSLIQQGHDEPVDGHGYLVWDIASKTAQFMPCHNDYGYHTIPIINGIINQSALSAKPRIRFEITETDPKVAKQLIADYCAEKDVQETIVFTHRSASDRTLKNDRSVEKSAVDPYKLIGQLVPSDHYDDVISLHDHYKSFVTDQGVPVSDVVPLWHLKSLEFNNMFCYTNPVSIDFMEHRGLIGIFGANHSGKSSIIDVILYCLYDKCSRGERKEVLNYGKTEFSCALTFALDGKDYRVSRIGKLNKATKALKVEVELWRDGDNVTGKDRYETNQRIADLIGSYDDLTVTAVSLQGMTNSFIDMTQSNRKKLLNDIMRLNYYEKLHELANTDLKETNAELKVLEKSYHPDKIKTVKTKIAEIETQFTNDTQLLQETQQKIDETQKEKESLLRQLILDIPECGMTADEINTELCSIQDELKTCPADISSQIESLEFQIAESDNSYRDELDKYNSHILELKTEQSRTQREIRPIQQTQYDPATLEQWKSKLENTAPVEFITKEIGFLDDVTDRLSVFEEDEEITQIINMIAARKQTISTASQKSKIPLTLSQIVTQLKYHEDNREAIKHNETIEQELLELARKIKSVDKPVDESVALKKELARLKKQTVTINELQSRKDDLEECLKYHEQIAKNDKVDAQIKKLEAQLTGYKMKLKKLQSGVTSLNSELTVNRTELEKLVTAEQNIAILKQEQSELKLYVSCVHKDGIPHLILKDAIPYLEHKVNEIVSLLTDFKLEIVTDGKDVDLLVSKESGSYNILMASGFEKFVCSVAIRVAMMSLSLLPKPNFIMIDEGFGAFDADNLGSVNLLLEYLKSEFGTVIIISHIDLLKNDIDNVIVPEDLKKKPQKTIAGTAKKAAISIRKK